MEHSASAPTTTSSSSPQRGGARELQLQGPRPAPLRVHKDSHRIRKPPVRQPVIIYTVSPKVVHADPAEFMSVVQRLTGASSSSSSLPPPPPASSLPFPLFPHQSSSSMLPPALPFPFHVQAAAAAAQQHEGALLQLQHSPAARLAAVEQASAQPAARSAGVHRGGLPPLPSILSPVPGSLPAIPPGFFSPPSSSGGINLFGELISPAFLGGHGALSGATPPPMSSSLQYFHAAAAPSPSPLTPYYWDLFNNHPNHP
ncbi:unnamed protein product [Alopecurus aequalis]